MVEVSVRQLPSTLAQLAHLAALRGPNTDVYAHPLAQTAVQLAEANQLFKRIHEQAFRCWLNYCLEQQEADLGLYLSGLDCSKPTVVKTWLDLESYRSFAPASATAVERQLFLSDLEALLRTMSAPAPGLTQEMEPSSNGDSLMTTAEVSKWLRVPSRTVRFWPECDEIPAVKVGRQWRFRRKNIEQWLEEASGEKKSAAVRQQRQVRHRASGVL